MTARASSCPVCAKHWPETPHRCTCGYDLECRDPRPALVEIAKRKRRADVRLLLGVGVLAATVPTLIAITTLPAGYVLIACAALAGELGFGAVLAATGLVRRSREGKLLATAKTMMQLPAARVVVE